MMEETPDLRVDLAPKRPGALVLRNPVIAAGFFGYGREFMRQADSGAFGALGALVTRETTLQRSPGMAPRLAVTPAGVLAGDSPNAGLRAVLRDHAPAWAAWPLPVILAVAGQSAGEYARIGVQVEGEPGVAGLQLDLSLPPEPGRPAAGWDPAEAWLLVHALRETTTLPVVVRLPWSGPALVEVARAAALAGADALALVSPLPGLAVGAGARRVTLAGGIHGPALLPLVLRSLRETAQAKIDVPLVAADGVLTGEDAAECLMVGASAVMVGAAALRDPRAPAQVLSGLVDFCNSRGIREIKSMVGSAQ